MSFKYGSTTYSGLKTGVPSSDYSFNHTVAADSNLLIVITYSSNRDNYRAADTVTWNTDPVSVIPGAGVGINEVGCKGWYLFDPTPGEYAVRCIDATESFNAGAIAMDFGGLIEWDDYDEATGSTDPSSTIDMATGLSLIVSGATCASNTAHTPVVLTETLDTAASDAEAPGRFLGGYNVNTKSSETVGWTGTNADFAIFSASFSVRRVPKVIAII